MPNFDSDKITNAVPARSGVGVQSVQAIVDVTTGATTGGLIRFARMPKGAVIIDTVLDAEALGGTLVLDLGTNVSGEGDVFIDGSTVANASGKDSIDALKTGYQFAADGIIQAVVASGTSTSDGKVACTVLYTLQNQDALAFS